MRLTVRLGTDPIARADATLLAAMGLPGGGIARIGRTHVLVRPADVGAPTSLLLGERAMANAGVAPGQAVPVARVNLPQAMRVILDADTLPLDTRHLVRALQGLPVTAGDVVAVDPSYAAGDGTQTEPINVKVLEVVPGPAGLVGSATVVGPRGQRDDAPKHPEGAVAGEGPTTGEALLAGLDAEVDTLSGWLKLLTSPEDLPSAWGLPRVAGVVLEGPAGCGKSELVAAAAARAEARVEEISLELVFKPERLLDVLEKAVKAALPPLVLFVDRLEAVAGEEGLFRTQTAAILRWFLDAVAGKPGVACVLGVGSAAALGEAVVGSPLLPRRLVIPPPSLERRRLLFAAALRRVPAQEIDHEKLAARSAGFSGADIVAAVVHASAMLAAGRGPLTTAALLEAIAGTTPSLGSVPTGEMPAHGFDRVADLAEVKQRLTEAVVWPITDPERFSRLGITPPRGLLLYGPPGTGKTFVVRALAHEAGAAFFSVKGAELLDKYVGESERAVREVFARARAAAPSILFFDEIDALCPVRGRSTTTVTDTVVAAMLTEMDGIAGRGDVVVIGATNRIDLIDPALLRAGRFESHLELGLPDVEARRALLGMSDIPFADDVDLDALAEKTEGLSFADLTGLLREAALEALRRDAKAIKVGRAEITKALARPRVGD
ncbi:MAG: ATP-binding protein [Acidimicrobiia bacterium]|nr:ATP-binding protein [Acidimicrobiia bacterium]